MKSNLTKTEFKQRLSEVTSQKKTLFKFTQKPFFGTFSNSSFDLVRNSFWPHVKMIRIKGEYVSIGYNATEVFYEIGVSKAFQFFSLLFLCSTFIGINVILVASRAKTLAVFTFSGFCILAGLVYIILNRISIRIINQKFQAEFEIEAATLVRSQES